MGLWKSRNRKAGDATLAARDEAQLTRLVTESRRLVEGVKERNEDALTFAALLDGLSRNREVADRKAEMVALSGRQAGKTATQERFEKAVREVFDGTHTPVEYDWKQGSPDSERREPLRGDPSVLGPEFSPEAIAERTEDLLTALPQYRDGVGSGRTWIAGPASDIPKVHWLTNGSDWALVDARAITWHAYTNVAQADSGVVHTAIHQLLDSGDTHVRLDTDCRSDDAVKDVWHEGCEDCWEASGHRPIFLAECGEVTAQAAASQDQVLVDAVWAQEMEIIERKYKDLVEAIREAAALDTNQVTFAPAEWLEEFMAHEPDHEPMPEEEEISVKDFTGTETVYPVLGDVYVRHVTASGTTNFSSLHWHGQKFPSGEFTATADSRETLTAVLLVAEGQGATSAHITFQEGDVVWNYESPEMESDSSYEWVILGDNDKRVIVRSEGRFDAVLNLDSGSLSGSSAVQDRDAYPSARHAADHWVSHYGTEEQKDRLAGNKRSSRDFDLQVRFYEQDLSLMRAQGFGDQDDNDAQVAANFIADKIQDLRKGKA